MRQVAEGANMASHVHVKVTCTCYENEMNHSISVGSLLMERLFRSATARCVVEVFGITCAVYIEDCESWQFSGCCST